VAPAPRPAQASGKAPPRPTDSLAARLGRWLQANWVLVVAAVSLGLAGVFLVQYGIEQGLLTPAMRVVGALGLGIALIGAGEWVRRRSGDTGSATAAIPSAFAGAGLVSLTAGFLSAHLLYGLIGVWPAFAALLLVAVTAVALGWFYGPFLAAAGLSGAMAVPFIVAPDPGQPMILGYLALVVLAGLTIDTVRRWAWASVLVLVLGAGAAFAVYQAGGMAAAPGFLAFGVAVALMTASVPARRWRPDHPGPSGLEALATPEATASFPVKLAWGGFAAAGAAAFLVTQDSATAGGAWAGIATLGLLSAIAALWFSGARGLADLGGLPAFLFLAVIGLQGVGPGPLATGFATAEFMRGEQAPPATVTILAALAMAGSALMALRGLAGAGLRPFWSAGAAVLTPAALGILHWAWSPAAVLGDGSWALHAAAGAALMALCAERTARADRGASRRVAGFALAAIALIAFALALVLAPVPLTLAMGAMVLAAALLDRRFDMDLLGLFIAGGTLLIFWRMGLEGLGAATRAPFGDLATAYGGVLVLLAATAIALRTRNRWRVQAGVEAAAGPCWRSLPSCWSSVCRGRLTRIGGPVSWPRSGSCRRATSGGAVPRGCCRAGPVPCWPRCIWSPGCCRFWPR
jgi:uncharacterized membrane protein